MDGRDQYCDGFETYILDELGLSGETFLAYQRDVHEFLGFIDNQSLTAKSVETFVHHLRRQGLKPATVRRKCMSIRCLCHHLISLNRLDKNIVEMIDPIKIDRRTSGVIEDKDVDALVSVVRNRVSVSRENNVRRDVSIILILYYSGLRVSELCGLDLDTINLLRREVRVMGKGGRERIIPITIECATAVREYIELDRTSDANAVFVKSGGQRITRRAVSDMLASISNKAGVRHTTSHTLRRSCATSLMNRKVDLELVQSLLGHRSLATTQSYLSVSNKKLVELHKTCHPFGEEHEL